MAYNTQPIVTDVDGNPVSQYYNPTTDQYEPVEGSGGGNKVVLYNADGTENNSLSLIPILEKLSELTGTVIDEQTRQSNEQQRITFYNQLVEMLNTGQLKGDKGDTGEIGRGLEFDWDGTRLGVRVEGDEEYIYVDLRGPQGPPGEIENLTSQHIEDALGYLPVSANDLEELRQEVGEAHTSLNDRLGNVENLDTTEKANLVLSLNETYQELAAHKAENAQQNECVFSNLVSLSNELPINPRKYDTNFGTVLTGKEIKESYSMSSGIDANASITKNDEVIYTPKFTSTNNIAQQVSLELPSSLDLSDTSYFEFECFIDNLESFRVFQLRFYSEQVAVGVGYFQGQIHTTLKYTNKNGWRKIRIHKAYFAQVPSESPPDWSNITHVNIQIYSQPEQTVNVYIKSITHHKTIGTILFDFDDAHDTIYDLAFPILERNQLVGNANITTGFIGDENRLTWEQVKKLYNAGWAICGHGHSHLDYTTLTEEQIRNDISLAQKNMREHGYQIGSLIHVANFAAWNAAVHDIVKQYCRIFRTLNSNNVNAFPPNSQHEFYYTADTKTVIENKSFIDKVIAEGGLGVLNFHSFYVESGTGYNIDDFEEIVNYVKTKVDSGLLRVMNRYEVYLL